MAEQFRNSRSVKQNNMVETEIDKKITEKTGQQNGSNDGYGCETEGKRMMKHDYDMDEWLKDRIDEDLIAMADEREKLLMESEELQDIDIPVEKLAEIHRRIEERNRGVRRIRVRWRMAVVLAAVLVLCAGIGLVGSGSKLYRPEIIRNSDGDEAGTKVENTDSVYREFDEEQVCQEIEEKLGVLPVRFGYQPNGMYLELYWVKEEEKNALLCYKLDQGKLYIYINKEHDEASIGNQPDGKVLNTLDIESCGLEVEVLEYQNDEMQNYYTVSFEYLNTYYSFGGMMEKEEFIKILENIAINNV